MSNLGEEFYWKLREEDPRDPKFGWTQKLDNKQDSPDGPIVSFFQKTMPDTKMNVVCVDVFYPKLKMGGFKDFF